MSGGIACRWCGLCFCECDAAPGTGPDPAVGWGRPSRGPSHDPIAASCAAEAAFPAKAFAVLKYFVKLSISS